MFTRRSERYSGGNRLVTVPHRWHVRRFFDDKAMAKAEAAATFKFSGVEGIEKRASCARLAPVWSGAKEAAEVQSEELARPRSGRTAAAIVSQGLREGLCTAYMNTFGENESPSVRDQGSDHLIGLCAKISRVRLLRHTSWSWQFLSLTKELLRVAVGAMKTTTTRRQGETGTKKSQKLLWGPITNRDELRQALRVLFTTNLMVVAAFQSIPRVHVSKRQSRRWQDNIVDTLADATPRPSLNVDPCGPAREARSCGRVLG